MEKLIEDYKGIILFYVIIALLAFMCTWRLNSLNSIGDNEINKQVEVSQYA